MSKSKKQIFISISAAKYLKLQQEQGVDKALRTLARDIGGKGRLSSGRDYWDETRFRARFNDISAQLSRGVGTLTGEGETLKLAKANLLDKLLDPAAGDFPSPNDKYARLVLGGALEPSVVVKVRR